MKQYKIIASIAEEIVEAEELLELLKKKPHPVAYDGFEPSGKVHIAQGLMRAHTISRLLEAGVKFKMLVADWHAWANDKLGGDLEKIKVTGEYLIEVWKACGLNTAKVEFVWASDLVKDDEYWKLVMKIARLNTVRRIIRTSQIMGRGESDALSAAQILYPCMQCADIFYLGCDFTQLGMDQRKVNVLAREVAPKLGFAKPVIVSHHMLMGLLEPLKTDDAVERAMAMKMSKSKPDSAIFMTDSTDEVKRKISKAYCPAKQTSENPLLEYVQYIVLPIMSELVINRPAKFGGLITYNDYGVLERDFSEGTLHPMDLKNGVADALNQLIEPVRKHFSENKKAKELLTKVESYTK